MDSPPLPARQRNDASNDHIVYYHPNLKTIDEVKSLMVNYLGKDGAFLVRNSFSKPDSLTVSVMHDNGIKHFNLAQAGAEYYVQDVKFPTISALVQYYANHDVPNQEGIKHVRLKFPIENIDNSSRRQNQYAGSSGNLTLATSSPIANRFGRSFSTLPLPLNRKESTSSVSSAGGSDNSRRHTTAVDNVTVQLPTIKTNGNPPSVQGHHKHRKSLMEKLTFFSKNKKRNNSDETLPVSTPEREEHERIRTQSDSSLSERINNRPPLPLPELPNERQNSFNSDIPQYDHVRDVSLDRASDLIQTLKRTDTYDANEEKCECGLGFEESELPRGWSMHISHDTLTYGRLFFMGPNQETAWNLPLDVSLELSPEQQDRIRDLYSGQHIPKDPGTSGAVGVSLQPASMPSSPPVSPNGQSQSSLLQRYGQEECDGGTSSIHNDETNHRHPTQHNETTGSTEGSTSATRIFRRP